MKNDSDGTGKKDKSINRIKDKLAKLREKLKASEDQQSPLRHTVDDIYRLEIASYIF